MASETKARIDALNEWIADTINAAMAPDGALEVVRSFYANNVLPGTPLYPALVVTSKTFFGEPITPDRSDSRMEYQFTAIEKDYQTARGQETVEAIAYALIELIQGAADIYTVADRGVVVESIDHFSRALGPDKEQPQVSVTMAFPLQHLVR